MTIFSRLVFIDHRQEWSAFDVVEDWSDRRWTERIMGNK